jgi:hypothetical protein
MNWMTWHDNIFYHHIQPYMLLERGGTIDALMHAIYTSFYLKTNNTLTSGLKHYYKKKKTIWNYELASQAKLFKI